VTVFRLMSEQFQDNDTWRFIVLVSVASAMAVAAAMAIAAPTGIDGFVQRFRPTQLLPVEARLEDTGDR